MVSGFSDGFRRVSKKLTGDFGKIQRGFKAFQRVLVGFRISKTDLVGFKRSFKATMRFRGFQDASGRIPKVSWGPEGYRVLREVSESLRVSLYGFPGI